MSQTPSNEARAGQTWYRFEQRQYSVCVDPDRDEYSSRLEVEMHEFWVVRVTPKGVWLIRKWNDDKCPEWGDYNEYPRNQARWVSFDARKRFACSSLKLAEESFIARKDKQISIYTHRIKDAERAKQLCRTHRSLR